MESPDVRGVVADPNAAVYARMEELQRQMEEMRLQLQSSVKLETVNEAEKQTIKSALEGIEGVTSSKNRWRTNSYRSRCSNNRLLGR